jgi:tetratricopeptide (TPR) repeat protein
VAESDGKAGRPPRRKERTGRGASETTHALAAPDGSGEDVEGTDSVGIAEAEEHDPPTNPEAREVALVDEPVEETEEAEQERPSASLRVEKGPSAGRVIPLLGDALIAGRSRECDVVIGDPSISRRHFRLMGDASGYRLEDMGSGNGTRVNGSTVDVTDLLHGTRIQVGTTTLVYELEGSAEPAPPPRTSSPVSGPPAPVSGPPAPVSGPPAPVSGPPAPVIRPRKARETRSRPPIWLFGVGGLALVAVVLVGVLIGNSLESGEAGSSAGSDGPVEEMSPAQRAEELTAGGMISARDGKWMAAMEQFEGAQALHPLLPGLAEAYGRAVDEVGHARTLESAVTALEGGRMDEAIGLLRSIPGGAADHPKAQFLLASSKLLRRNIALESVRSRLIAGDSDGARRALTELLAIVPKDLDALALKERVEANSLALPADASAPSNDRKSVAQQTGKNRGARKTATRKSDRGSAATRAKGESTRKKSRKSRSMSAGSAAGIAAYRAGKFTRAAELLEAAAAKAGKENAARLQEMARSVLKFEKQYNRGKSATSLAASTKPLERAYRADQKLGGHFAAELKPLLADKYAKRAAEAYSRQVYGSAAIFARKALQYDAGHLNAKGVLEKTQSKGKGMFEQGTQLRLAGNKAAAEVLFRQVLKILPSSDLLHRKARQALEEMSR